MGNRKNRNIKKKTKKCNKKKMSGGDLSVKDKSSRKLQSSKHRSSGQFKSSSRKQWKIIQQSVKVKTALKNLYNLQPKNEIEFLGFKFKFHDLGKKNEKLWYPEKYNDISSVNQSCRWGISKEYFNEVTDRNFGGKYLITVECHDSYYEEDFLQGFIIAKDVETDKDGIYLALVCASEIEYWSDEVNGMVRVKLRLGEILQTILMTYCHKKKNIKNIYLEAANKGLVNYYRKFGYNIFKADKADKKNCEYNKIEQEFKGYKKGVEDFIEEKGIKTAGHGILMRSCNFNVVDTQEITTSNLMKSGILKDLETDKDGKLKHKKTICNGS